MEAVLRALETAGGDLSDGQQQFRAALAKIELDSPNGHLSLDENRQAIGSAYLYEIDGNDGGALHYRVVKAIDNVDASFGGHFDPGDPLRDRTQPACEHGRPPAWAAADEWKIGSTSSP